VAGFVLYTVESQLLWSGIIVKLPLLMGCCIGFAAAWVSSFRQSAFVTNKLHAYIGQSGEPCRVCLISVNFYSILPALNAVILWY